MSNICITVLMGLPGSGKTTLAMQLMKFMRSETDTVVHHISYDRILPADVERALITSAAETEHSAWKQYRQQILQCVDESISSVKREKCACGLAVGYHVHHTGASDARCGDQTGGDQALPSSENNYEAQYSTCMAECTASFHVREKMIECVRCRAPSGARHVYLIDDNMYYASMRYSYYQLARKYEVGFAQVFVQCDLGTAIAQNGRREQNVPDDIITAMNQKMEPPVTSETWQKHTAIWDVGAGADLTQLKALIDAALTDPVQDHVTVALEMSEASRVICSQNLVHQIDKCLRKLVKENITSAKNAGVAIQDVARAVNAKKTRILDKLRRGEIRIPSELEMSTSATSEDVIMVFARELFEAS